jgi:RNA polymerase sigma-70 factor (ECF subfamily)
VRLAGTRKEEDFEAEALPHLNDLFRTAARLLGDRGKAEDIVQETYLQAWKSFHRYQRGTNCRAWLFKILFHTVYHYRRKWLSVKTEGQEYLEENLAYTEPVADRLTDHEIVAALERIPAEFRSVVLLADVEEFSYREIAGILDIPIGTVMSRLSRARKLLRSELAELARSMGFGNSTPQGQGA